MENNYFSELKKCTKCIIDRPLNNYYKCKRYSCGLFPICKFCNNKYCKEYRINHIEEAKKRHKKFIELNPNYYRNYYLSHTKKYINYDDSF